jgi:hypothetical protein
MLSDHPLLASAAEKLIRDHSNFDSSLIVEATVTEMGQAKTLGELFDIPIKNFSLDTESALIWMMFLTYGPAKAVEEGDAPFPMGDYTPLKAIGRIHDVYDLSMGEYIDAYFEEDSDDESDEESEESDEEAAEGKAATDAKKSAAATGQSKKAEKKK